MDFRGAAKSSGGGFGHAEIFYFSGFDQIGHGADGFFDRGFGVDAVLVVEIDYVDAEAFQAGVATFFDVGRVAADAEEFAVWAADVGEFGGKDDFAAAVADGFADEELVFADAVHVGGVEEIAAEVEVAVDDADRFGVVHLGGVVEFAHSHAAEAQGGDGEAGLAEFSSGEWGRWHEILPVSWRLYADYRTRGRIRAYPLSK
jgi:hypothetical protein